MENQSKLKFWSKEKVKRELKSISLIVFILLIVRTTLFEPFHIPSGSMLPTLDLGDFILVNKTSYGIKVPFSEWFKPIYLTSFSGPKFGDVVVFKFPKDPSLNFIKRIIAVPGDEIEIKNKEVFLNGMKINVAPIDGNGLMVEKKFQEMEMNFFKVEHQGKKFNIQLSYFETPKDHLTKMKIPENYYFVLGDNRDFSMDSRFWGLVPMEAIKGKAFFIWLSVRTPIFEHEFKPQFYRMGKTID